MASKLSVGKVGLGTKRWRARKAGNRPEGVTNHLARDFAATTPNMKWVTEITYIRTAAGWLDLAVVVASYARQVIGWSMQPQLDRELVLQAVVMAVWQRTTPEAVMLHADRGTQ